MNRQNKMLIIVYVVCVFFSCSNKNNDVGTKKSQDHKNTVIVDPERIKYERLGQKKIGNEYKIISKDLIYNEENKRVYSNNYKNDNDEIIMFYPYFRLFDHNRKKWITAAAFVNSNKRNSNSVVIIFESDENDNNISIFQILNKEVYDLFPQLFYGNDKKKIFLLISYQEGSDWSDVYILNLDKQIFEHIPDELE